MQSVHFLCTVLTTTVYELHILVKIPQYKILQR